MKTKHDRRRHSSPNTTMSNKVSGSYLRSPTHKKMKMIVQPERFDGTNLSLVIKRVVLLLNPPCPSSKQLYKIMWRIDPGGREHASEWVIGYPNPKWNKEYTIGLKVNPVNEGFFLNVEVLTCTSMENRSDPGTSSGIGEVLRARIPFPKRLNDEVRRHYELVKSDGAGNKIAGDIFLSMELKTCIFRNRKK